MAHHKSAIKRIRTSSKANQRNRHYRSSLRTAIRKTREAADRQTRLEQWRTVCSLWDRLVSKGVVHRNSAARNKSRLYRHIQRLEG